MKKEITTDAGTTITIQPFDGDNELGLVIDGDFALFINNAQTRLLIQYLSEQLAEFEKSLNAGI